MNPQEPRWHTRNSFGPWEARDPRHRVQLQRVRSISGAFDGRLPGQSRHSTQLAVHHRLVKPWQGVPPTAATGTKSLLLQAAMPAELECCQHTPCAWNGILTPCCCMLSLLMCSAGSILVPEVVTRGRTTNLKVRNVQVLATLRDLLQANPEGLGLDLCHSVSAHQWWQRLTLDLEKVAYAGAFGLLADGSSQGASLAIVLVLPSSAPVSKWTMMPMCPCACQPCLQLLLAFCDLLRMLKHGTRCALPGVDDFVLVTNTRSQTQTFAYWGLHNTQLVAAEMQHASGCGERCRQVGDGSMSGILQGTSYIDAGMAGPAANPPQHRPRMHTKIMVPHTILTPSSRRACLTGVVTSHVVLALSFG